MHEDLKIFIVCEGYDDYLERTLPHNIEAITPKFLARDIIIITHITDRRTRDVAYANKCLTVISGRLHKDDAPFAKGKAINDALGAVEPQEWVLLLDADIYLPRDFKDRVHLEKLDKNILYYVCRWEDDNAEEANPFGYFQLFNIHAKSLLGRKPIYPEASRTAGGDDDNFGLHVFDSTHRTFFTGFHVDHIPHGEYKKNWRGRVTPRID